MKRKILPWALIIFWMALIFYLSHQPATESDGLSIGITEKILELIQRIVPDITLDIGRFNHIVRKNAHFFVYLVLGVLVANGLTNSSKATVFRVALLICVLYAISDEVHQLFVPGRGGQIKDVIIDSTGSLVGILGYILKTYKE